MYRASAAVYWRPLSDTFWRSISPQHVPRVAAKELELYRTITTSPEESATESVIKIIDALRFGEKSKASDLLSTLGCGNYSLKANDFVGILDYCARSPDPLFLMETWRVMEENQISPDHLSSLLMMRTLCKGGYLDEAFRLLNLLGESQGDYPLLPIYNTFLDASARMRSIDHANKCLDLMDSGMMGQNEVTYLALLKLAVQQNNKSAVQDIWNEYTKKYSLNIISLRQFIWAFARVRDLNSAYGALQQMTALAMTNGGYVFKNRRGKLSSSFDIPIPLKQELGLKQFASSKLDSDAGNEHQGTVFSNGDEVPPHFQIRTVNRWLEDKRRMIVYERKLVMKVLRWSFNDVIHVCGCQKNYELAEQLLAQMQKLGVEPSKYTYASYVKALVRKKGFRSGIEVLKIMQRRKVKVLDRTLAILSKSCSKALELDLAEALLNQISEPKWARVFNVFMTACDRLDKPERALRALRLMRRHKILPSRRTYELLFSLFCTVNAPYEVGTKWSHGNVLRRVKAIEKDMEKNGVQHSHLSMKYLLRALGAEKMRETMIHYLQKAETLLSDRPRTRTPIYNSVLHSLVKAKKSHMAVQVFQIMRSGGMSPDEGTYNIMIECCTLLKCFTSACGLISLMYREGFNPEILAFTALIKILLKTKKLDEALDLFNQVCSQDVKVSVVFFNTILRRAAAERQIDVIEFVVERMHQHKIKPDPITCNCVFSTYVRSGLHDTAMEALQVLSWRMLCQEYGSLSEEDLEIIYDELVLTEDEKEPVKRMLQLFKNYEEHLAVALLSLRWCAMLGYSMPWPPEHSSWAKRLSATYGRDFDTNMIKFSSSEME